MRALITGIRGFAGRHLADHLGSFGDEVWGLARRDAGGRILAADLADPGALRDAVRKAGPEVCYHLAAQSVVPLSYKDPVATWTSNVLGTMNLYEALRMESPGCRVVFAGTCEVYGVGSADRTPMTERSPLAPANPYAASKAAADLLSEQYARHFALPVVRLRLFNHTGPGQPPKAVCSDFANRIARIERKELPPVLEVGDLRPEKDFTDVRDIVRAYRLAATKGTPGEAYNIGSGRAVSIRWILDRLLEESRAPLEVRNDPSRYRPADTRFLAADVAKAKAALGWTPEIPLERTLKDTLEYWRKTPP